MKKFFLLLMICFCLTFLGCSTDQPLQSNSYEYKLEEVGNDYFFSWSYINEGLEIIVDAVLPKYELRLSQVEVEPGFFRAPEVAPLLDAIFPEGYHIDARMEQIDFQIENIKKAISVQGSNEALESMLTELLELKARGGIADLETRLMQMKEDDPTAYSIYYPLVQDLETPPTLLPNERWTSDNPNNDYYVSVINENPNKANILIHRDSFDVQPIKNTENAANAAINFIEEIGAQDYSLVHSLACDTDGMPANSPDSVAFIRYFFMPIINKTLVNFHWIDSMGAVYPIEYKNSAESKMELNPSTINQCWQYPTLYVDVDADGIMGGYWSSPVKLGRIYSTDIISVKECIHVAQSALVEYSIPLHIHCESCEDSNVNHPIKVLVDEITYGYSRVFKDNRYYLVPSLNFNGVIQTYMHEDDKFSAVSSLLGERRNILCINLCSGELIERRYE